MPFEVHPPTSTVAIRTAISGRDRGISRGLRPARPDWKSAGLGLGGWPRILRGGRGGGGGSLFPGLARAPARDHPMTDSQRFATDAIHAGQDPDPTTGGGDRPDLPDLDLRPGGPRDATAASTTRGPTDPTRTRLGDVHRGAGEGSRGFAFGSGMAAIAALATPLSSGDHVVASTTCTAAPSACSTR